MELDTDNQTSSGMDNQSSAATETSSADQGMTQQSTAEQVSGDAPIVQQPQYQPFAKGKERFKIDGKDEDWDWDTTKKYASMGKAGYQRMQEASELKKKVNDAYSELMQLAKKDPEGLIRALNPNYVGSQSGGTPQGPSGQNQTADHQLDPRDMEVRGLKEEVQQFRSYFEKQEINVERQAIEKELTDAETKYSPLKGNKFAINYIKSEYRKALANDLDVSIDDIAFQVAQEIQDSQKQKTIEQQKIIAQKRKAAPVSGITASPEQGGKAMSLDDVRRLAGRSI